MNTAATQINVPAGQLTEQPGRRIIVHRDGTWQIDIPVQCSSDDVITLVPNRYTPSEEFPLCGIDEISAVEEEGDIASFVLTYKGVPAAGATTPVFELIISSQQDPLESNPLFVNVSKAEILKINNYLASTDPNAAAPTLSDAGQKLLDRKILGQTDYLSSSTVWRMSYASNVPLSGENEALVCFIDTPPGNPPTPSGYTWLYTGASQTQEGLAYRISREWRRSAKGGWDNYIYNASSTPASGASSSSGDSSGQ